MRQMLRLFLLREGKPYRVGLSVIRAADQVATDWLRAAE